MEAAYESWRFAPLVWEEAGRVRASIAYRGAPVKAVVQPDSIMHDGKRITWYHRNREQTVFDLTVKQQQLEAVKGQMWNPLKSLTFGGYMEGDDMTVAGSCAGRYVDTDFKGYKLRSERPRKKHHLVMAFHTEQTETLEQWQNGLQQTGTRFEKEAQVYKKDSRRWWNQFWDRSYVVINPDSAQAQSSS